jgi:hypothetical protein
MKRKIIDLAERTGATFAQAFLAAETVDQTKLTQVDALKLASIAGAFAVAKYFLAEAKLYLARHPQEVTIP